MLDLEAALYAIRQDARRLGQLEQDRLELLNSPLNAAMKDERDQDLKLDIERQRKRLTQVLRDLVAFPPQHGRHAALLASFNAVGAYAQSVFVMTKFPTPGGTSAADQQLARVIQAVRDAVKGAGQGHVARLASDQQFHGILWDNVELYLLGCSRGIAIVEDRYLPELNPNVAMEWGWMRGMGRNVLFLVEKNFKQQRADWGGLIEAPFDWDDPEPGISAAVLNWLPKPP